MKFDPIMIYSEINMENKISRVITCSLKTIIDRVSYQKKRLKIKTAVSSLSAKHLLAFDQATHEGKILISLLNKVIDGKPNPSLINQNVIRATAFLDHLWELLNTGIYSEVPLTVKISVTWGTIFVVYFMIRKIESELSDGYDIPELNKYLTRILYAVDQGLIMGCPIKQNPLKKIAFYINRFLQSSYEVSQKQREELVQMSSINQAQNLPKIEYPFNQTQDLSLEDFIVYFLHEHKPVLLQNIVDHWPAIRKWNWVYIKKVMGARYVPIELGSKYTEDSWTQTIISVNEFVDKYVVGSLRYKQKAYLAQHEIFNQIPELKQDFSVPDYCLTTEFTVQMNIWIGPDGTISPLHYDDKENILVQVFGYKYIRVYDKIHTEYLYPRENKLLHNTSEVDVEDEFALEKWPLLKEAPYNECILGPGQSLFIPKGFWHYVRSLTSSCSISFWWPESND